MTRKGIILAGGSGSRLRPITNVVSKQLLPIFNKPMIYFPLTTLMLAGVRDILIITTPKDQSLFKDLLGDGSQWALNLSYAVQAKPAGLAQALTIGEEFLQGGPSVLILGDNLFYGPELPKRLKTANSQLDGATIFTYRVADPERYGVAEIGQNGKVVGLEEKPEKPKSDLAVTGLYFFDERAPLFAGQTVPSARGELEITDVISRYIEKDELYCEKLDRGHAWLDTGTFSSLLDAGQFVKTLEERQGLELASPAEISFLNGWIDKKALLELLDISQDEMEKRFFSHAAWEGPRL